MATFLTATINFFVYHFVSGQAFFSGNALLPAGILLSTFTRRRLWRITGRAMLLSGAGVITISATPLSMTVYLAWGILTVVWFVAIESGRVKNRSQRIPLALCATLPLLFTTAAEVPYHVAPSVPEHSYDTVYILGDSLAAGMRGQDEHTWPSLLREKLRGVTVQDLAHPGATVHSALGRQTNGLKKNRAVVLLEIGGNDLLGDTSPARFADNLDALLETVSGPGRLVVLLELPLPPFENAYGKAQRRLAAKHGAVLIPKSYMAGILLNPENTIDGIHLSRPGHRTMASMLRKLLSPALAHMPEEADLRRLPMLMAIVSLLLSPPLQGGSVYVPTPDQVGTIWSRRDGPFLDKGR